MEHIFNTDIPPKEVTNAETSTPPCVLRIGLVTYYQQWY